MAEFYFKPISNEFDCHWLIYFLGMEDGSIDNCVVGAQQLIVPPEVPVPVAVPQQPQEQQSSLILTPAQLQLQRQLR